MYCNTHVNQFSCILNELYLWTHISSDHPVFLRTVAGLSKIKLPRTAEEHLEHIHEEFNKLHQQAVNLRRQANPAAARRIIDEFLRVDSEAIAFYPQLLNFGKGNAAWKELVNHIIDEQKFMYELMRDLRRQV